MDKTNGLGVIGGIVGGTCMILYKIRKIIEAKQMTCLERFENIVVENCVIVEKGQASQSLPRFPSVPASTPSNLSIDYN